MRMASPSPAGSPETSFRELDDAFLQRQTKIWLEEVLRLRFNEETPVADLLSDGELLFQVSILVLKLVQKNVDLKHSKAYVSERNSLSKSRYMPYTYIDSFLKACQLLGMMGVDMFSPSDVVEKKDIRRVCMCIRSFSKRARSKNMNVPDFDIVAYSIVPMSTYVVGSIRRSLEQSQSSSSSSSGNSPVQKILSRCLYKYNSLYYESDEVESRYTEIEAHSPISSRSNFGVDYSNFSEGDSVVDENGVYLDASFHWENHFLIEKDHGGWHSRRSLDNFTDSFDMSESSNSEEDYQNGKHLLLGKNDMDYLSERTVLKLGFRNDKVAADNETYIVSSGQIEVDISDPVEIDVLQRYGKCEEIKELSDTKCDPGECDRSETVRRSNDNEICYEEPSEIIEVPSPTDSTCMNKEHLAFHQPSIKKGEPLDNRRRSKNIVLKSIAGGITLAAAVSLFLHLRGNGGKAKAPTRIVISSNKNSHETQAVVVGDSYDDHPEDGFVTEPGVKAPKPKKVDSRKSSKVFYPGDRLHL